MSFLREISKQLEISAHLVQYWSRCGHRCPYGSPEPTLPRPAAVVCDDLSGACEVAGLLHQTGHSTTIALTAPIADGSINVVDLALRDQTEDIARRCMRHAVQSWDVRYVKIDSLVRGPVRRHRRRLPEGSSPTAGLPRPALSGTHGRRRRRC